MNKVFRTKWNAAIGAWVACSELARNRTQSKSVALLVVAASIAPLSFAQGTCATYTNDVINSAYTCVPVTVSEATWSASGHLMGQGSGGGGTTKKNMHVTSSDVVIGSPSSRKTYTTAGAGITTGGWDSATLTTNNTISAQNVSMYLDGASAGTNSYAGVGVSFGGKIWLNNFTLDIANANNGDLNGLVAGAAYNDKTPNGGTLTNYVHVAGDYNFKAVKADMNNAKPTTGIRAIQNNDGTIASGSTGIGPNAVVTVDGTYTADITSGYGVGVYVSGKFDANQKMPVVNLNDVNITLHGKGIALKIGKTNRNSIFPYNLRPTRDGWGAGQINIASGGNVVIDTTDANGEAIAITYGGSVLDASQAASFRVNAKGNVIRVGNDILFNALQPSADLIDVKINNAYFRTTTPTSSLIQIDQQQKDVSLLFTGAETDLTAASDGYIIDVQGGNAAQSSAASLVFDDGAHATGLVNKTAASTLNIGLSGGSTWNLAEKATGSTTTSTFTALNMEGGSVLNAFNNTGAASFILAGDVSSAHSTISMADQKAGDVLTLQGNYTGLAGSRLLVDGIWNDPNNLTTDIFVINGDATGSTAVSVPGGIFGDVTQADQPKVSDKPVITVSGTQSGVVFTGSAPTLNAGEAQLIQVGNNYHWTLEAKTGTPIYHEDVPTYLQAALVNKEMGFAQMGKLHERVGEQQTWAWDDCGTRCEQYQQFKDKGEKKYPVWGRINGDYLKLQGKDRFAFKSKTGFVQFGADLDNPINQQDESRRHNGAMLTYGWGSTDFYDQNRAQNGVVVDDKYMGKADTTMLSVGGYSTWYAKNGTYLDLVGNLSWIRNKYNGRDGGSTSQNGYGLGLSAEVGRPWRLGESRWQIEPQAQLSYQHIHLKGFHDGVRDVKGQSLNGLRGRIGGRLAWNAQGEQLRTRTFYLTGNVLHDFAGNKASVTIGREDVRENYGRTWGELGLGGQLALSKSTYLYGDVRYQHSFDSSKGALGGAQRKGYNGRIGVRHTW